MILRRLIALLTSVTMLQLSVVAGDSACATSEANGHHAARTSGGAVAEHVMPMGGHEVPRIEQVDTPAASTPSVVGSHTPPCETPVQRHCCDAVAGCGTIGVATSAGQSLCPTALAAACTHETLHDAPASFASAPEPPPPKA
jgi:hypothetical protein